MPFDPIRVADTRAWLQSARRDLGAGSHDLKAEPPFTGDAMFHAQQAVEKTLKGFLAWHEIPFRKTHDLRELFRACVTVDASLEPIGLRAEGLSPYAWVFRYPGETEEPTLREARAALRLARETVRAIGVRLPEAVRS
jgi:HEPN domain-containing protein